MLMVYQCLLNITFLMTLMMNSLSSNLLKLDLLTTELYLVFLFDLESSFSLLIFLNHLNIFLVFILYLLALSNSLIEEFLLIEKVFRGYIFNILHILNSKYQPLMYKDLDLLFKVPNNMACQS